MTKPLLLSLLATVAIGCVQTRSYDVSVHNHSPDTVTLWLTKEGPPAEKGWLTPEDFVKSPPDEPSPGVQLPAGKTADTGKRTGKFPGDTHAILLVYRYGASADGKGKSAPLLIQLQPGKTELAVDVDNQGRLFVYNPVTSTQTPIAIEP